MWVDIAALTFTVLFAIFGYLRGLFSQAWSLGALVVSFFASGPVLALLQQHLGDGTRDSLLGEWILKLLVGLGIYVGLLAIGYLLEKALVERFKLVSVSNRFLGATLGLAKGGLAVVGALWLLTFFAPAVFTVDATVPAQLADSKIAAAVTPYNPLNLLLLARVKPYLPQADPGERHPVKAPKAVQNNNSFKQLVADASFLEAYHQHNYMEIIRNPAFHQFVQDKALLDALEKQQR